MFDLSYKSMLELAQGMRKYVQRNPQENNLREMARALLETDALRGQEDHENNELVSEALSWFRRLNEQYPKEEYKEFVRRLESGMPRDQV